MTEDELKAKRWLRELRKESGLSQKALAEIVGTTRRTVLNAESEGEDAGWPNGFTLLRMLQELGAVEDAPALTETPLSRLEEKADEALTGIGNVLDLLREALGQSGADAQEGSPP